MEPQSANAVPAGASANEHSRVATASSTLLASFVKFSNATYNLHHASCDPRSSKDVTYSCFDRSTRTTYRFGHDNPTILLCPVQTVFRETRPSKYADGMWRYCQERYTYHSMGKSERVFTAQSEDKIYVTGGDYEDHRYRKIQFVMNDGTKKMFAVRERVGETKKLLSDTPKTEEGLNSLFQRKRSSMVWLDTSLPKTDEFVKDASLEFKQCYSQQEGVQQWNVKYMLFVKIVSSKNGRQTGVAYYPLFVSLTDFSTKGAVPPLFESETAELVRGSRGDFKKELAERVFHPMRVFKMMETYGDDWDEKI